MGAQTASTGSKVGAAHLNYALCEEQRSFGLTVLPTYLLFLNLYQDHRLPRCDVTQSGTKRDDVASCCFHSSSLRLFVLSFISKVTICMRVIRQEEVNKSSREQISWQCVKNNASLQLWHLFVCLICGDRFCLQDILTAPLQFSTLGISEKFFVNKVWEAQAFVSNKKEERKKKEWKKEKNKLVVLSKWLTIRQSLFTAWPVISERVRGRLVKLVLLKHFCCDYS